MNIAADYHVHSRFSDGQAPPRENILAALQKGLSEIALTEHGPKHLASGIRKAKIEAYLDMVTQLKREFAGKIRIKTGIEANPVDLDGAIDLPEKYKGAFEVIGLGFHRSAWGNDFKTNAFFYIGRHLIPAKTKSRKMTDLLIKAMEKNPVSYIAHPGQYTGALEWERLAKACREQNVAIEISARTGHLCFTPEDARIMRDCGAVFVVNSDAHKTSQIGGFESLVGFLQKADLGFCDIINAVGYEGRKPFGL